MDDLIEPMLYNFTLTAISFGNITINNTNFDPIETPRIGIYSGLVIHTGFLVTDNMGCQAGMGSGRGFQGTDKCSGGGGSYGGTGGYPVTLDSGFNQQICSSI